MKALGRFKAQNSAISNNHKINRLFERDIDLEKAILAHQTIKMIMNPIRKFTHYSLKDRIVKTIK